MTTLQEQIETKKAQLELLAAVHRASVAKVAEAQQMLDEAITAERMAQAAAAKCDEEYRALELQLD